MDNRGSFFFFLFVFYLLLSTQSRPPLIDEDRERQRELVRERHALRLLNDSSYGDFDPLADRWLPFEGVRKNDSYAWDMFPHVQDRAREQLRSALSNAGLEPPIDLAGESAEAPLNLSQLLVPVYRNATGKLRGDWVRRTQDVTRRGSLNTTAIALEHEYFTHEFGSNITGNQGTFYFTLEESGKKSFESVVALPEKSEQT